MKSQIRLIDISDLVDHRFHEEANVGSLAVWSGELPCLWAQVNDDSAWL